MFRGAALLGCFWIFGTVYYNVDMMILQRLVPPENVAWYAAAYRLFNAAIMVVGFASGTVLYPVLSRLAIGSREGLRKAMARSFTYLLGSGVFLMVTLLVTADQVVALLFPTRQYGEAADALRLLAPGLALMHASGVFFLTLLGMGFERRLLVMAAVLAVLNPLANLLGIPLLQQNAAAIITPPLHRARSRRRLSESPGTSHAMQDKATQASIKPLVYGGIWGMKECGAEGRTRTGTPCGGGF